MHAENGPLLNDNYSPTDIYFLPAYQKNQKVRDWEKREFRKKTLQLNLIDIDKEKLLQALAQQDKQNKQKAEYIRANQQKSMSIEAVP